MNTSTGCLATPAGLRVLFQSEASPRPPLVTVIVTLYNYRQYIAPCLESVAAQTLPAVDLLVVDDCSPDDSARVAQRWCETRHPRFSWCRVVRHGTNQGLCQARNTAFALARTEQVFVLDADNLIYPRCLERLTSALEHCDASFAYSYLEKFGCDAGVLSHFSAWNPNTFRHGNRIDAMVLMRRQAWERAGGYSKAPVQGWEDFELWFKLARRGAWGILVPEILCRYRVHHSSMLRTVTNPNADQLWSYLRGQYPEFFVEGVEAPNWLPIKQQMEQESNRIQGHLHHHIALLQGQLSGVYGSRSYWITAPLRYFAHRARMGKDWMKKVTNRLTGVLR